MTHEEREAIRAKIAELQALVDAPERKVIRNEHYEWDGRKLTVPDWENVISRHSAQFASLIGSIGHSESDGRAIASILTQLYAERGA